jgi:lauroyl/myristoyl acyltransferase
MLVEDPAKEKADSRMDSSAPVEASAPEKPIPAIVRGRIWLQRAFLVTCVRCFSLRGLYLFGSCYGTYEYLTDYKRRGRVHRKLREYFGESHPASWYRRVAHRYFMRTCCDKFFYMIMDRIPRSKLMNRIKVINPDEVDAELAASRGVYVALCHWGSHHVAGLMMALRGYPIAGVRDEKESPVRRYIAQKYRDTFPEVANMKMLYSTTNPRQIMRHMQSGGVLASLLDVARRRGDQSRMVPVQIFGQMREFLVGPIQLALRAKAGIFQGFVVSRKNYYYQLICAGRLTSPDDTGDEDATIATVMQRYADNVEAFARAHPDHLMNI